ncbi:hypothetical protein OPV22_033617 [Ensete ventricosum]|uniref:CTLH domain-containing protein n=1 Tax=Ensete ventricosum TaxID=4639 RepID=A0AAV8P109_ENSVE|nr:hypothetical protein OPV22_033617 [Ensete ventricosum]
MAVGSLSFKGLRVAKMKLALEDYGKRGRLPLLSDMLQADPDLKMMLQVRMSQQYEAITTVACLNLCKILPFVHCTSPWLNHLVA